MNVVYVTGNEHKARYFVQILGMGIEHAPADVDEIQSLNLADVVAAKAKAAYQQIGKPVIVEDTLLSIDHLGRLPGTYIKWFIEELGLEKICRLADGDESRTAYASAAFAYYDGTEAIVIEGGLTGKIAVSPQGDEGFGWNPIFIPEGQGQTMGEMDDATFKSAYTKIKPFDELRTFLQKLEEVS